MSDKKKGSRCDLDQISSYALLNIKRGAGGTRRCYRDNEGGAELNRQLQYVYINGNNITLLIFLFYFAEYKDSMRIMNLIYRC